MSFRYMHILAVSRELENGAGLYCNCLEASKAGYLSSRNTLVDSRPYLELPVVYEIA